MWHCVCDLFICLFNGTRLACFYFTLGTRGAYAILALRIRLWNLCGGNENYASKGHLSLEKTNAVLLSSHRGTRTKKKNNHWIGGNISSWKWNRNKLNWAWTVCPSFWFRFIFIFICQTGPLECAMKLVAGVKKQQVPKDWVFRTAPNFLHFCINSTCHPFILVAQFKRFPWLSLKICCRRICRRKLLKIHKTKGCEMVCGWQNGWKMAGSAGGSATAALELIVDI